MAEGLASGADSPTVHSCMPVGGPASFDRRQARIGLAYGLAAYLAWGIFPLYFKFLLHVPAVELLAHRIFWSAVFVAVLLTLTRRWGEVRSAWGTARTARVMLASTLMIGVNWWVFIHAIATSQLRYASLGYYINPLVSVALGVLFLRDPLRPRQMLAILLAVIGVGYMTWSVGHLPWISVTLALTFGMYGLLRKIAPVGPLPGLLVESSLLAPLAAMTVFVVRSDPSSAPLSAGTYGMLMLAGVVTALPLIWFAAAARRLRLGTMGMLQYIAPTCQLILAVTLFHEPFDRDKLIAFAFIWTALGVYSHDSIAHYRSVERNARDRASAELAAAR